MLQPNNIGVFRNFPKEMEIISGNPWFREYGCEKWSIAFFMNTCIYKAFEDNYRGKYVGVDPFLDAMNSLNRGNVYGYDDYDAAYMAAREIFQDEKSLEKFILEKVVPSVEKKLRRSASIDLCMIRSLVMSFNLIISSNYIYIYDRCDKELLERKIKLYEDKKNGKK
jgi:hypothetical protein